mmetsp:Transcript_38400/g.64512  ORF Transcript_38400/g.64512 Transcript_38400/m.64512 type:complete len:84 (+) Transcript_38400:252-503(+)
MRLPSAKRMRFLHALCKRFRGCSKAEEEMEEEVEEAQDQEEEVVNFIWPSMKGTTRGWTHEGARSEDAFAVVARSVAVVSFSR